MEYKLLEIVVFVFVETFSSIDDRKQELQKVFKSMEFSIDYMEFPFSGKKNRKSEMSQRA